MSCLFNRVVSNCESGIAFLWPGPFWKNWYFGLVDCQVFALYGGRWLLLWWVLLLAKENWGLSAALVASASLERQPVGEVWAWVSKNLQLLAEAVNRHLSLSPLLRQWRDLFSCQFSLVVFLSAFLLAWLILSCLCPCHAEGILSDFGCVHKVSLLLTVTGRWLCLSL